MTKIYARLKPNFYREDSLLDTVSFLMEVAVNSFFDENISKYSVEHAFFFSNLEEAKASFKVTKLNPNDKTFFSNASYNLGIQDAIIEFELDDKNNIKAIGEAHSIEKVDKSYVKCQEGENQFKKVFTPVWTNYPISPEQVSINALSQMNKLFQASELFKSLKPEEVATSISTI